MQIVIKNTNIHIIIKLFLRVPNEQNLGSRRLEHTVRTTHGGPCVLTFGRHQG